MGRILLIQPPLQAEELFVRGSKPLASLIPPLGLAYIASYLRMQGHECSILDGIAQPKPLAEILATARDFEVVGITAVSTNAVRAAELIRAFKDGGLQAPIVVGGPHVTALPESLLRFGADVAVIGEGEVAMLELANRLTLPGPRNLQDILGVAFLEGGNLVLTPRRPVLANLDEIPPPARDLLPMHLYRSSITRATQQPSHSMLTSRGCPGACTFCSKKTFGTTVRYFSVGRIVEEFFELRDRYGARDIAVWDDSFVSDPDTVLAVCEELTRRRFGITFSVEARVDSVDRATLAALKKAGCTYIAYGIESGSQRLLDYMNKRVTKEQIREAIRLTKEAGLAIRAYFMLGMPSETAQEMQETIDFAKELNVELASFTVFTPLPGTVEYQRALKSGYFPDPEYYLHRIVPEFNLLDAPLYVPEGMTGDQLMAIHRSAYNQYYFRPRFLLRSVVAIHGPEDVRRLVHGAVALAKNALPKWR